MLKSALRAAIQLCQIVSWIVRVICLHFKDLGCSWLNWGSMVLYLLILYMCELVKAWSRIDVCQCPHRVKTNILSREPRKRRPMRCRFPRRVDSAGPVSPTCNRSKRPKATRRNPQWLVKPNSGLTQSEFGRLQPLLCPRHHRQVKQAVKT
jgi:hypothetical protein